MLKGSRAVGIVVAVLAAFFTASASALERVGDGGFETGTICTVECLNGAWVRSGERVYFCETGKCSGAAAHGRYYVQFGGGTAYTEEGDPLFFLRGQLEQLVEIPAAPAQLSFSYAVENSAGVGEIALRIDGVKIFSTTEQTSGEYNRRLYDVSAYAGPGKHDLRFEFRCGGTCTRIYLDDISLDAFDPASAKAPVDFSVPSGLPKCRGRAATIGGAGGTLTGTSGPDVIVGSSKAEKIRGKGGDDLICAGGGADKVSGGPGLDILAGQKGNDTLTGGPSQDILIGGPGKDRETP